VVSDEAAAEEVTSEAACSARLFSSRACFHLFHSSMSSGVSCARAPPPCLCLLLLVCLLTLLFCSCVVDLSAGFPELAEEALALADAATPVLAAADAPATLDELALLLESPASSLERLDIGVRSSFPEPELWD